ncbi:MAG: RluA family pseudouridine synthase [Myxococcota bacterium]
MGAQGESPPGRELPGPARLTFVVAEEEAGGRVDSALAEFAGLSRSRARRWIEEGRVRLDQKNCRPSQRVRAGAVLEAVPPEPRPSPLIPEAIPLAVLHEDSDLIVVDKPAGLVVHPAPGHPGGTLVNALLHHCGDLAGVGGVLRPGIVHRLDRGTSGVLVAAKTDEAHRALAAQFQAHSIEREYCALVRGVPGTDTGRIDRPVGRHPRDRKRMSVRSRTPREARTNWRVRLRFPISGQAWLEVRPETGRTHQIRVHLASVGMPIVGDPIYGRARVRGSLLDRPALHAARLGFVHPRTGEPMSFEAPLPADLTRLLAELESAG